MVAIHTPCGTKISGVSAHWSNDEREPAFFVNDRKCNTCPNCYEPLTFETMDPRTPEQAAADAWQAEYREDPRSLYLGL